MNAAEFIAKKVPVPSEMLTRDWAQVRADLKARSFFMAGVANAEVLQLGQDVARREAAGELSRAESRRAMRQGLAVLGYVPPPGTEGSIKDLRTERRQNAFLDTQLALAQGAAGHAKQEAARVAFPYQQLIRVMPKKRERRWAERFAAVAATLEDTTGIDEAKMIAPLGHELWVRLSVFGHPWPIFDWGSGMGVRAVGAREAKAAGLPVPVPGAADMVPQGMNEKLEARPAVTDDALRSRLITDLRGTAEWSKEAPDVLVFLDPDGTRPTSAERLRGIWEGITQYRLRQQEALDYWRQEGRPAAGSDHQYHLMRLLRRLGWRGEELPVDELPEVVGPLLG